MKDHVCNIIHRLSALSMTGGFSPTIWNRFKHFYLVTLNLFGQHFAQIHLFEACWDLHWVTNLESLISCILSVKRVTFLNLYEQTNLINNIINCQADCISVNQDYIGFSWRGRRAFTVPWCCSLRFYSIIEIISSLPHRSVSMTKTQIRQRGPRPQPCKNRGLLVLTCVNAVTTL